jgi:hypothetical protein
VASASAGSGDPRRTSERGEEGREEPPEGGTPALGEEFLHHLPIHIRQPVIPSRVAEGEAFVVEAEEVEDGGVEVVDVDLVLDRTEAEVVGGAVGEAAADAAAGQPGGEAPVVVVPAVPPFGCAGAAEFAPPDDRACLPAGRGS